MATTSLDELLNGLRAVAEPSRLRLLAICSHGEWTVSELVQVMAQSQPRISRHLKLLADAGLLERFREGVGHGGPPAFQKAGVGELAEFIPLCITRFGQCLGTLGILRRLAAVQRDAGILRSQVRGVVSSASAPSRSDPDVSRQ